MSKFNIPGMTQPGLLLPGHPGGVNWYEQRFWTPADICDIGKKGDTKTILGTLKFSKL